MDAGKFLTGFSAVGSIAIPAILAHAQVTAPIPRPIADTGLHKRCWVCRRCTVYRTQVIMASDMFT
jgi:hypothetical protein